MNSEHYKIVIEAAIFAAPEPLSLERLQQLFDETSRPSSAETKALIDELMQDYADRGVELQLVASGYRFQARSQLSHWLQRLWERKPPRYSRALLETLALIAYRQPTSRGEIEQVRGVAVSSDIIKKLLEREWIKVVGQRDVPGKPALFGTTKHFLDYFNLQTLADLPPLQDLVDLEQVEQRLHSRLMQPDSTVEAANDENLTLDRNQE